MSPYSSENTVGFRQPGAPLIPQGQQHLEEGWGMWWKAPLHSQSRDIQVPQSQQNSRGAQVLENWKPEPQGGSEQTSLRAHERQSLAMPRSNWERICRGWSSCTGRWDQKQWKWGSYKGILRTSAGSGNAEGTWHRLTLQAAGMHKQLANQENMTVTFVHFSSKIISYYSEK